MEWMLRSYPFGTVGQHNLPHHHLRFEVTHISGLFQEFNDKAHLQDTNLITLLRYSPWRDQIENNVRILNGIPINVSDNHKDFRNILLLPEKTKLSSSTRMHSSRMRTAHSSGRPGGCLHQTPPWSRHPPDTPLGADTHPREQTPPRADTPQDQAPPHPPEQTPPRTRHPPLLLTESQTPVKTLPRPNFVAAGKKIYLSVFLWCNNNFDLF